MQAITPALSGALDIVVDSDMALPKDIDSVSLQVSQAGHSLLDTKSEVGDGLDGHRSLAQRVADAELVGQRAA